MINTKSLDNKEYELDEVFNLETYYKKINEIHRPERIIAAYNSFGINSRLCIDYKGDTNLFYVAEIEDEIQVKLAKVVDIQEDKETVIIKAVVEKENKKDKIKFVNSIVKEIDFRQGLCNEVFVKMLSNVFSEERLKEILESDDIQILSFKGLMYLKLKDRAYRL